MFELQYATDPAWTKLCLENFEAFLVDHAASERKASATSLNFVVKFRDKPKLIDAMIRVAREELEHFHDVCKILGKLEIPLGPDEKNPYIQQMLALSTNAAQDLLRDRLLLAAIIELRGSERFGLIAQGLKSHPKFSDLADYYQSLAQDEIKHFHSYLHLAELYYDPSDVQHRAQQLLAAEGQIMKSLPVRLCLH